MASFYLGNLAQARADLTTYRARFPADLTASVLWWCSSEVTSLWPPSPPRLSRGGLMALAWQDATVADQTRAFGPLALIAPLLQRLPAAPRGDEAEAEALLGSGQGAVQGRRRRQRDALAAAAGALRDRVSGRG